MRQMNYFGQDADDLRDKDFEVADDQYSRDNKYPRNSRRCYSSDYYDDHDQSYGYQNQHYGRYNGRPRRYRDRSRYDRYIDYDRNRRDSYRGPRHDRFRFEPRSLDERDRNRNQNLVLLIILIIIIILAVYFMSTSAKSYAAVALLFAVIVLIGKFLGGGRRD